MNVYVATRNPVKLQAVRDAFEEWYPRERVDVRAVDPADDHPEQPLGERVPLGAVARARAAVGAEDADRGVGIEAGLIRLPGSDRWLSVQVCAIADRGGRVALGLGPGYELPEDLRAAVLAGAPLRDAFQRILAVDDAGHRGAIHHLSAGRLDRYEITVDAVRMAILSNEHR